MKRETKEALTTIVGIISTIIVPIILIFIGYFFVGFLTWISTDPLDLFDDGTNWFMRGPEYIDPRTPDEIKWDNCVTNTKYLYDQFNDTPMTTYGTDDKPATEAQNFMRLCLEKS